MILLQDCSFCGGELAFIIFCTSFKPVQNFDFTAYYVPVADVSSPGSESMSPTTPHAVSPAIQSQSTRNYFGTSEPKMQTSVAVVSGRPSLNGTQVDTRRWLFDIFNDIGYILLFDLFRLLSKRFHIKKH